MAACSAFVNHVLNRRRAGVLCALSSLAPDAHQQFLAFLEAAGIGVWQVLPLNPPDIHGSPYSSASLFAGHPALLSRSSVIDLSVESPDTWLLDYARFVAGRKHHGAPWMGWPNALKLRREAGIANLDRTSSAIYRRVETEQLSFAAAWNRLKHEAHERRVLLMGDMPLYPAHDSADVWAHPDLFDLASDGRARAVAGVPPDYFSATGQYWGNPVYRWPAHVDSGFRWWHARLTHQLTWFDVLRIDHFRGLQAYWAIPPGESSERGSWEPAEGLGLLRSLPAEQLSRLVAEDLGMISPAVVALREEFALPGMRVLQFAFDGNSENPHLPHRVPEHSVVYTGTHDNDTSLGWYLSLKSAARRRVERLTGTDSQWPWPLIDAALLSPARTAIVPLQDYLSLDGRHRMNTPGTISGNWGWRVDISQLTDELARSIRRRVEASGRLEHNTGEGR